MGKARGLFAVLFLADWSGPFSQAFQAARRREFRADSHRATGRRTGVQD